MAVWDRITLAVGIPACTSVELGLRSPATGARAFPASMSGILRKVTAFGGRVVLGVTLFAFLTPPFGLRAYLEARAQDQAEASHVIASFFRPAAAVLKIPVTARPFAQTPRS